jgi:hypothetical protein
MAGKALVDSLTVLRAELNEDDDLLPIRKQTRQEPEHFIPARKPRQPSTQWGKRNMQNSLAQVVLAGASRIETMLTIIRPI